MMVTGFRETAGFREFHLQKKKNAHSMCSFTAGRGTYHMEDNHFLKDIKVYDCDDTDAPSEDALLMTGTLQKIKYAEGYSEDLISVSIISKSAILEKGKHTRIFQSTQKTYRDILEEVCSLEGFELVLLNENFDKHVQEKPIIQLGETNMEFICRIASLMGADVWVDDKSQGRGQIRIGDKRGDFVLPLEKRSLMVLETERFPEMETLRIRLERGHKALKRLDIGRQVEIEGKIYTIHQLNIDKQSQAYAYECLAVRRLGEGRQGNENHESQVRHFTGKVVGNRDPENRGRVQVDFNSQQVTDISHGCNLWIDVATIYDGTRGGVVFIPDKDDWVDAIWDGNDFLVTGVRRKEAILADHQNIDEKCIVDQRGRKLCFGPRGLSISAGNSTILVNEDKVTVAGKAIELN